MPRAKRRVPRKQKSEQSTVLCILTQFDSTKDLFEAFAVLKLINDTTSAKSSADLLEPAFVLVYKEDADFVRAVVFRTRSRKMPTLDIEELIPRDCQVHLQISYLPNYLILHECEASTIESTLKNAAVAALSLVGSYNIDFKTFNEEVSSRYKQLTSDNYGINLDDFECDSKDPSSSKQFPKETLPFEKPFFEETCELLKSAFGSRLI